MLKKKERILSAGTRLAGVPATEATRTAVIPAPAAVAVVTQERCLTAVLCTTVTISPALVTQSEGAGPSSTARKSVGKIADDTALAAVVDVGEEHHLAAVCAHAVAIGEGLVARRDLTSALLAERGTVRRLTGIAALTAVLVIRDKERLATISNFTVAVGVAAWAGWSQIRWSHFPRGLRAAPNE